ncbi:MAG: HEAT repeat domain-containing protein, partial [Candidatus Omnitrophica bacterium]|nr:HEAT repeat domain-containing protein [Candidatus Omnitrophota bacterium]
KKKVIERWVASSMTNGVLGTIYLAGPDMYPADMMGLIQETADKVRADFGLAPIPVTTSIKTEKASFIHEPWTVTSISAVEVFMAAIHNERLRKRYGIPAGTPDDPIDIVIQGFGDVGSGIVQYLVNRYPDLLKNGSIRIVAISNINGGIYHPEGLDVKELLRFRRSKKRDDLVFFREYHKGRRDLRKGIVRLKQGEDVFYVREMQPKGTRKRPIVALPAAGPGVFTSTAQIRRLRKAKVSAVFSPANNVVTEGVGLEEAFERARVLFFDARITSPGGIYTSTEEIFHALTEGLAHVREVMLSNPDYYRHHVQGGIAELTISMTRCVIEEFDRRWKLYEQGGRRGKMPTMTAIHQEAAMQIRKTMDFILANPSEGNLARVNRELARVHKTFVKRTRGMDKKRKKDLWNWVARVVILNTVTEIARARVMYHEIKISDILTQIQRMIVQPDAREPGGIDVMTQRSLVYEFGRMPVYGHEHFFLQILNDRRFDVRVRANAAEALGNFNSRDAIPVLRDILQSDEEPYLRVWAEWALRKMEMSAQRSELRGVPEKGIPTRKETAGLDDLTVLLRVAEAFRARLAPTRLERAQIEDLVGRLVRSELGNAANGGTVSGFNRRVTEFLQRLTALDPLLVKNSTLEAPRLEIDLRRGVPKLESIAAILTYVIHNPSLKYELWLIASPDEFSEFQREFNAHVQTTMGVVMGDDLSVTGHFAIKRIRDEKDLQTQLPRVVSESKCPAALIADEIGLASVTGYMPQFLPVYVDHAPDHDAAVVISGELLKDVDRLKEWIVQTLTRFDSRVCRSGDLLSNFRGAAEIANDIRHLAEFLTAA